MRQSGKIPTGGVHRQSENDSTDPTKVNLNVAAYFEWIKLKGGGNNI